MMIILIFYNKKVIYYKKQIAKLKLKEKNQHFNIKLKIIKKNQSIIRQELKYKMINCTKYFIKK